ncbi:MAG TPA: hypothetical protein V6C86_00240 [Oculatellaceae cyanobacterium]
MPNQNNDNSLPDILELLSKEGLEGTGEALRLLLNAATVLEREKYLALLITNVISSAEDTQMASAQNHPDPLRGFSCGYSPSS